MRARAISISALAMLVLLALASLGFVAGCSEGARPGRQRYNEGLALLAKGDHPGAQKAFLDAIDQAGVDPELRYRAYFNQGVSLAAEADAAKASAKEGDSEALAKALDLYNAARNAFGEALAVRKGDAEATSNLAIVAARADALADQLAQDKKRLEAKLDALIAAQRGVLEEARDAWQEIQRAASGDPLAQQENLTLTADKQRGISAEAGVVSDIAGAEIDSIGKKEEAKRSDEEKVRLVQLQNLDLYIMEARSRMAETRAKLQTLAAEEGVDRCEAALVALKRAKEQLLEPIAALQGIRQDQLELYKAASAVEQLVAAQAQAQLPVWLSPAKLAGEQQPLVDRLQEVEARLKAGLEAQEKAAQATPASAGSATAAASSPAAGASSGPSPGSSSIPVVPNAQSAPLGGAAAPAAAAAPVAPAPPDPAAPQDPKAAQQAKMMERVRLAMPSIAEALAAMKQATENLRADRTPAAVLDMRRALLALSKAIELFSNLKQTLDLAWREQKQIVALLGPEAAKEMPAKERAAETRDAVVRNLERLGRLRELLDEEHARIKSEAEQALAKAAEAPKPAAPAAPTAPAPGAGSGSAVTPQNAVPPGSADAAPDPTAEARQRVQQVEEKFKLATQLRDEATAALAELQKNLAGAADPLPKAKEADAKIEELRRLFFDIVEHLQELIRNQAETKDKTAAAVGKDEIQLSTLLPPVIDRQTEHRTMDQSIDNALAKMADQAAAGGQQGAEEQKKYAAAAEEMRLAGTEMDRASGTMVAVRDQAGGKSHDLKPATEAQTKALEHLAEALKILQPPQQQQQQDDKQQQQQQQQQQQGGATQSARDQDAQRQRKRDRDGAGDPVDKDW